MPRSAMSNMRDFVYSRAVREFRDSSMNYAWSESRFGYVSLGKWDMLRMYAFVEVGLVLQQIYTLTGSLQRVDISFRLRYLMSPYILVESWVLF